MSAQLKRVITGHNRHAERKSGQTQKTWVTFNKKLNCPRYSWIRNACKTPTNQRFNRLVKRNQFYLLVKLQLWNGFINLVHTEILEQEETWMTRGRKKGERLDKEQKMTDGRLHTVYIDVFKY